MALVVNKGLTVWMQAWRQCAVAMRSPTATVAAPAAVNPASPCDHANQAELIRVLAAMALGRAANRGDDGRDSFV